MLGQVIIVFNTSFKGLFFVCSFGYNAEDRNILGRLYLNATNAGIIKVSLTTDKSVKDNYNYHQTNFSREPSFSQKP